MNYRKLLQQMIEVTLVMLFLVGCGTPAVTTIIGDIVEFGEHPIAGRKITLCQLPMEQKEFSLPLECVLLNTIAVSDENGHFEFVDVPSGTYIFLYDSGLSDFDAAMQRWAGKTLKIGDPEWVMKEFLGSESGEVEMPLFRELANLMMHDMDSAMDYALRYLIVGNSPFIVAHDAKLALYENKISLPVAITNEENQKIEFPALFLGE